MASNIKLFKTFFLSTLTEKLQQKLITFMSLSSVLLLSSIWEQPNHYNVRARSNVNKRSTKFQSFVCLTAGWFEFKDSHVTTQAFSPLSLGPQSKSLPQSGLDKVGVQSNTWVAVLRKRWCIRISVFSPGYRGPFAPVCDNRLLCLTKFWHFLDLWPQILYSAQLQLWTGPSWNWKKNHNNMEVS